MKNHKVTKLLIAFAITILFSGCVKPASGLKVNKSELKPLENVEIQWLDQKNLQIRVTKTQRGGTPVISQNEYKVSQEGVKKIVTQYSQHLYTDISQTLAKKNITTHKWVGAHEPAYHLLTFKVESGYSACTPLFCNQSILIKTSLKSQGLKKVWEKTFTARKDGYLAQNNYSSKFTKEIIKQLLQDGVIQ